MPRILPGDPLDPPAADGLGASGSTLTTAARAQLRATYHLDQPLEAQFVAYIGDLTATWAGPSAAMRR